MKKLEGLTIALLVADGFEQSEMQKPRLALDQEGAITKIVSPKKAKVRGWSQGNWADEFPVDVHLFAAKAAICHGPWTLINAGAVKGKMMTSWPSIKIDLINAGARWEDKEVVRDGILVTSRKPDDIPSFNKVMIELFAEKLKN